MYLLTSIMAVLFCSVFVAVTGFVVGHVLWGLVVLIERNGVRTLQVLTWALCLAGGYGMALAMGML